MSAKQALGRGLKALIPDRPTARAGFAQIPVDRVRPNPLQPRHRFDDDALAELAASIRRHGVLQPLLVSEDATDGYLLITGERRWRAARLAGLQTVPAVIRERIADEQQLELALVENLQRRDLTPLEEARAFDHLRSSLGLSQQEIADRVGMDRSTVANSLRLLKLSDEIQAMIELGELSAGHGRALLAFDGADLQSEWARRAVATGLSVRMLEQAATESREATSWLRPISFVRGSKWSERFPGTTLKLMPVEVPRLPPKSTPSTRRAPTWTPARPELLRTRSHLANVDLM